MFVSKRHLASIEKEIMRLQDKCASMDIELNQLKCKHSTQDVLINYDRVVLPDGIACGESGIVDDYVVVCRSCNLALRGCDAEEKARREYEAAKEAYNKAKRNQHQTPANLLQ